MRDVTGGTGPHAGQAIATAGAPLRRAKAAAVLVHGRGAEAEDMLSLAEAFVQPNLAYLAPQAAGRTWYPFSLHRLSATSPSCPRRWECWTG